MNDSLLYKIALSLVPGLNSVEAKTLLEYFGSAEAIFIKDNLEQAERLNPRIRENILYGKAIQKAHKEMELIEKTIFRYVSSMMQSIPTVYVLVRMHQSYSTARESVI
jgi:predicted Rossmann fold nucleotide-binding protein DprA/Smf involved in DNA uptake